MLRKRVDCLSNKAEINWMNFIMCGRFESAYCDQIEWLTKIHYHKTDNNNNN